MSSRLRILALGALATPAAFFCAQGAVQQVEYYRRGTLVWLAALLASAALHGLWVGLVRGGAGTLTAAGCWAACAALAGAGLRAWHIQTSGWMLEGLVAAVALVLTRLRLRPTRYISTGSEDRA